MAVSVPPPLYHLNTVSKFRDDSTTPTAGASAATTTATSPKMKNKRKSHEPKKVSSSPYTENPFSKRIKVENCLDGSDGEPTHSPSGSSTSSSDGTSSTERLSQSPPSSSMLAPKKRFKQEALKYLEEEENNKLAQQQQDKSSSTVNPFRPWDNGATSPTIKPQFPTDAPSPFLYNPFFSAATFFPSLLAGVRPLLAAKIEPTSPSMLASAPDLSALFLQRDSLKQQQLLLLQQQQKQQKQQLSFKPSLPIQSPPRKVVPAVKPKIEPKSRPASPSPTSPTAVSIKKEFPSTNFDAETCQVLSRLYPFLLNRGPVPAAGPGEPEQEEPLALVTRKSEPDDEDEVFVKKEEGEDPSPSGGRAKQRNYKNMTRERRIEANARERQRVHTITAAFDRLQGAIPTADDVPGNKLSKLSIIKIATSYIMVLSRMSGHDYSGDESAPSIEECIRQCADLVKAEAKTRKKSSESSD